MNKNLVLIFITIITLNSYSQTNFQSGYFIYDSGLKVECLIKNIDWLNNPSEFEYKLSENSNTETATMKTVKEFEIYGSSKYEKHKVRIDRSSDKINKLDYNKNPEMHEEILFLRVLIKGKASLFDYSNKELTRYFFSNELTNIKQLIFKKYYVTDAESGHDDIKTNNSYKQQLWSTLKCNKLKIKELNSLSYTKNSLVKFITKYNNCENSSSQNYTSNKKKDLFNLTLRPRLNSSNLNIFDNTSVGSSFDEGTITNDYNNKLSLGFGIEAEYILPFNNNKWSIMIEPTYQIYKSEATVIDENISGGQYTSKVNYSSIELPIGLRHYFFINKTSKIFLNASYVIDFSSKSEIEFNRPNGTNLNTLSINGRTNMAFGIGYKVFDKYNLEIRYQTNREILANNLFFSSEYQSLSLIFGYSLF